MNGFGLNTKLVGNGRKVFWIEQGSEHHPFELGGRDPEHRLGAFACQTDRAVGRACQNRLFGSSGEQHRIVISRAANLRLRGPGFCHVASDDHRATLGAGHCGKRGRRDIDNEPLTVSHHSHLGAHHCFTARNPAQRRVFWIDGRTVAQAEELRQHNGVVDARLGRNVTEEVLARRITHDDVPLSVEHGDRVTRCREESAEQFRLLRHFGARALDIIEQ